MDKCTISRLIHDSHEILSCGYGDLDIHGRVKHNTLEDWNYQRNVKEPITRIIQKYLPKKPFVMLDAGCGNGQLFHLYSNLGAYKIYGVDFGQSMLRLAVNRAKVNSIRFIPLRARLEDLGCIKADRFDLINMYGVIEHLPDHTLVLCQLERVLAPDGILIVSVPRKWSLAWLTYFLFCRSLADYAGQETRLERVLRFKKMALYRFFTKRDIGNMLPRPGSMKLLETFPIAYGGVVGQVNWPLRKAAQKGNYTGIDRWNRICKSIGMIPAGEYLVLQKVAS